MIAALFLATAAGGLAVGFHLGGGSWSRLARRLRLTRRVRDPLEG